ncbi:hypothetical protein RJD24_01615 [Bacillaceae bacterium IKA-2]|nr:hypothetical protein RJD24_01615 [Bacillaceae bacterium IKA-2]
MPQNKSHNISEGEKVKGSPTLYSKNQEDFLNAFILIAKKAMDQLDIGKIKKEEKIVPVLKVKGD